MDFPDFTIQNNLAFFGWISLSVLLLIMIYQRYIKRQKNKVAAKIDYFTVNPLEGEYASGIVQLFIETLQPIDVVLSLEAINENGSPVILMEKSLKTGGNILEIDSLNFSNGSYFLIIESAVQKMKKRIEIRN